MPSPLTDALRRLHSSGRLAMFWLPGMRRIHRYPAEDGHPAGVIGFRLARPGEFAFAYLNESDETLGVPDSEPDLDDPATIGCLAAQCREAAGNRALHAVCTEYTDGKSTWVEWRVGPHTAPSEGGAWAAALIALAADA